MSRYLDEIKCKRPAASVKGTLWLCIGELHYKFKDELSQYLIETQD